MLVKVLRVGVYSGFDSHNNAHSKTPHCMYLKRMCKNEFVDIGREMAQLFANTFEPENVKSN